MRKKSLTKDEREIQIINVFQNRVMEDNWSAASLAQIGSVIGLSPSSHLRKLCERIADSGLLIPVKLKRSGRWQGRGYRPSKKHFKKPVRTATVNFSQHGINYKLEMVL